MDGQIAEVHLPFDVVVRPARVGAGSLVAGIGAGRREPEIDRGLRGVLNRPDESAAAAHEELLVPVVGQEEREPDLGADDSRDAAVRGANRAVEAAGTATASDTFTSGSRSEVSSAHLP